MRIEKRPMDPDLDEMRETRQKEIDRLSLELLSNTTHYKKYLAKTDPESKTRSLHETRRFQKHKSKVMDLLCELMDDYEDLTTSSVVANTNIQTVFRECVGKIMQFIEWRDCMEPSDDTLFSDEYMVSEKDPPYEPIEVTNSFWGRSITKSGGDRSASDRSASDRSASDRRRRPSFIPK